MMYPQTARGRECINSDVICVKQAPAYGAQMQLGFDADEVLYESMWFAWVIAAGSGIKLLERGQSVALSRPVKLLPQIQDDHSVFAGQWSPYQGKGTKLLSIACPDLEHHDVPLVLASTHHWFWNATATHRTSLSVKPQ
jgi:hypothetical protein